MIKSSSSPWFIRGRQRQCLDDVVSHPAGYNRTEPYDRGTALTEICAWCASNHLYSSTKAKVITSNHVWGTDKALYVFESEGCDYSVYFQPDLYLEGICMLFSLCYAVRERTQSGLVWNIHLFDARSLLHCGTSGTKTPALNWQPGGVWHSGADYYRHRWRVPGQWSGMLLLCWWEKAT